MPEPEQGPEAKTSEILQQLRDSKLSHLDLLKETLGASGGEMYGVDLLVMATTQRSLSLISGFITLVEAGNMMCAASLIRLQMDSVMRLHACWLVQDPHMVAFHLMSGDPIDRLRSSTGEKLSDRYLHESATKLYPWFSKVYKETSGFIHLSKPHMFAPLAEPPDEAGRSSFAVTLDGGREWRPEERLEAVAAFAEATRALQHLTFSWLETKRRKFEGTLGSPRE